MSKIVISGYYGFNNLGDEAILETMIDSIKSRLDDNKDDDICDEICVFSAQPKVTSKLMGVYAVNRYNICHIISEIFKCDIFISGGGSLLQDSTGKWSIRYYLSLILLALLCRKKVFLYAHGIGPVNGSVNIFLMKHILKHVHTISVRDKKSRDDLLQLGINKHKIHMTADPVVGMNKVGVQLGKDILKKCLSQNTDKSKPLIGFSLRTKDFSTPKIRQELKNLIKSLDKEYHIIFLPFHLGEDSELCRWAISEDIPAVAEFVNARQMISIVENLDVLVGERLHSLIFSAVAEIPFIGISYDLKIDAFMKIFDRKPLCKVEDFLNTDIKMAIDDIMINYNLILDKQNKNMDILQMEFDKNLQLLDNML